MDVTEILKDDEKMLKIFVKNVEKFNEFFSDMMFEGKDFTLRFEVRGNNGKMGHCRVSQDYFDRP